MRGRLGRGQGGHPGGTPLPRPPRNLPRAPTGPWNQESPAPGPNSNQMAQVENHCARRGRAGNWRLRVPGVCAVHGEAESTSTPPHKHHGVLGPRTRGWGCRRPSGGMRTGGGEEWLPREPLGKALLPWSNFLMAGEPEGIPTSVFPTGASGAQIVCGCLCGHLEGTLERELPLHLPWGCGSLPRRNRGTGCPCPSANLHGRREGGLLPASPAGLGRGRRRLRDAEAQATPGLRGWAGSRQRGPPRPPSPGQASWGPAGPLVYVGRPRGGGGGWRRPSPGKFQV